MTEKNLETKRIVCKKCRFKHSCSDLPAFCAFVYFIPPTLVIGMLVYLLVLEAI